MLAPVIGSESADHKAAVHGFLGAFAPALAAGLEEELQYRNVYGEKDKATLLAQGPVIYTQLLVLVPFVINFEGLGAATVVV